MPNIGWSLRASLERRFADCGLTLHPGKTKIVYCKDEERRGGYQHPDVRLSRPHVPAEAVATLAGYIRRLVQPRGQRQRAQRQVAGRLDPDVQQPHPGLDQLLRPALQIGAPPDPATHRPYSGSILARWAHRKFKSLRRHRRQTAHWITRVARRQPSLFAHWGFCRGAAGQWEPDEARVSRRFCERAAVRFHRATHLIIGFESAVDARRMRADLKDRLARYGLSLHEDKTRLSSSAGCRPRLGSSVASGSANLCLPRLHPLLRMDPGRPVHRETQDAEQAPDAQADGAAPGGVAVDATNPFLRARWRSQKRLLGGTSIGRIASKKPPQQARLIFDATLIAGDQIWFGNEDQETDERLSRLLSRSRHRARCRPTSSRTSFSKAARQPGNFPRAGLHRAERSATPGMRARISGRPLFGRRARC